MRLVLLVLLMFALVPAVHSAERTYAPPVLRPIPGTLRIAWRDASDADLIFLASAAGPEIDMPPVPRPLGGEAVLDAPPTWRPGLPLWACQRWDEGVTTCHRVVPMFVSLPLVQ
jgi:hypothetical protein